MKNTSRTELSTEVSTEQHARYIVTVERDRCIPDELSSNAPAVPWDESIGVEFPVADVAACDLGHSEEDFREERGGQAGLSAHECSQHDDAVA